MPIYIQGVVGGPFSGANLLTSLDSFDYTATNVNGVTRNVTHLLYSFISPYVVDQSGFVTASVDADPATSGPNNFDKLDEIRFVGSGDGLFILDGFIRKNANKPRKRGTVYIKHPFSPNRIGLVYRVDGLLNRGNPLLHKFSAHSNTPTLNTDLKYINLLPNQLAVGVLAIAHHTVDDPVSIPPEWTQEADVKLPADDGNGIRLIIASKKVTKRTKLQFLWNLGNPHEWATMCQVFSGF